MGRDGYGWVQMGMGGLGWTWMDLDGYRWVRMGMGGYRRARGWGPVPGQRWTLPRRWGIPDVQELLGTCWEGFMAHTPPIS